MKTMPAGCALAALVAAGWAGTAAAMPFGGKHHPQYVYVQPAPTTYAAPAPTTYVMQAQAPVPVQYAPAPVPVQYAPTPAPIQFAPAPTTYAAPAPVQSAPAPVSYSYGFPYAASSTVATGAAPGIGAAPGSSIRLSQTLLYALYNDLLKFYLGTESGTETIEKIQATRERATEQFQTLLGDREEDNEPNKLEQDYLNQMVDHVVAAAANAEGEAAPQFVPPAPYGGWGRGGYPAPTPAYYSYPAAVPVQPIPLIPLYPIAPKHCAHLKHGFCSQCRH